MNIPSGIPAIAPTGQQAAPRSNNQTTQSHKYNSVRNQSPAPPNLQHPQATNQQQQSINRGLVASHVGYPPYGRAAHGIAPGVASSDMNKQTVGNQQQQMYVQGGQSVNPQQQGAVGVNQNGQPLYSTQAHIPAAYFQRGPPPRATMNPPPHQQGGHPQRPMGAQLVTHQFPGFRLPSNIYPANVQMYPPQTMTINYGMQGIPTAYLSQSMPPVSQNIPQPSVPITQAPAVARRSAAIKIVDPETREEVKIEKPKQTPGPQGSGGAPPAPGPPPQISAAMTPPHPHMIVGPGHPGHPTQLVPTMAPNLHPVPMSEPVKIVPSGSVGIPLSPVLDIIPAAIVPPMTQSPPTLTQIQQPPQQRMEVEVQEVSPQPVPPPQQLQQPQVITVSPQESIASGGVSEQAKTEGKPPMASPPALAAPAPLPPTVSRPGKKKKCDMNKKGGSGSSDMDAFIDSEATEAQVDAAAPVEEKEDDEERRKVEVKNEENLRKSQEAIKESGKGEEVEDEEDAVVPSSGVEPASVQKEEDEEVNESLEDGELVTDDENDEVGDDSSPKLKYTYQPGQWSPLQPEGKKQYDRDFLLQLQNDQMSMTRPSDLPKLDILKSAPLEHRPLPDHRLGNFPPHRGGHQQQDFLPPYMRNGTAARGPGGGMGGGGGGSMGGRRSSQPRMADGRPKKVITLSSSLNQDVKLHVAEKAWKPMGKDGIQTSEGDDALYKKFRGILNKLTPQRFASLIDQVKKLEINSEDRLSNIAQLVLEKALNETHFASTYALLCQTLLQEFQVSRTSSTTAGATTVNFRKMLLQKCQQEFERDTDTEECKEREKAQEEERSKKLEAAKGDDEVKQLNDAFKEQDTRAKRTTLGLMRFIGELYNLNILNADIMGDCFQRLMRDPTDEDSIVCVCKLFTTVGKKLANDAKKPPHEKTYTSLMNKLTEIIHTNKAMAKAGEGKALSQRVIFMLEDVKELKERSWIPRRDEAAPKTLEQIQKDAEMEKVLANQPSMGAPGQNRYGSMGGGGGQGRRDGRSNYGSQSQSSAPRGADFKQTTNMLKNINLSASLGGPASRPNQWQSGASGGGSRNSSLRGNKTDEPFVMNKYDLLSSEGSEHQTRSRESSRSRLEKESVIQDMRKLNIAAGARSSSARGSAPASRSESLTGQSGGTHSLKGVDEEDVDKVKRCVHTIVDEYVQNGNKEDFLRDFCERAHANTLHKFLSCILEDTLESKTPNAREKAGEIIRELHTAKIASQKHVCEALRYQLEFASDMVIDVPKYWDYMAEMVAPMVVSASTDLFKCLVREVCSSLRQQLLSANMLLALFNRINAISSGGVSKLWQSSGLQLDDLVDSKEDLTALRQLLGVSVAPSAGIGLNYNALLERFQNALENTPPQVASALEDVMHQAGESKVEDAVRALSTALINKGLQEGPKESSKEAKFTFEAKALELDIDKCLSGIYAQPGVAIQALYAVQIVMNDNLHPREPLFKILNWFYEKELVSDEVFFDWEREDKKHEQTGWRMTVTNAKNFLEWLRATEPDE